MEAAGFIIEDQHHAMFGDDDDDNKQQDIKDQGGENNRRLLFLKASKSLYATMDKFIPNGSCAFIKISCESKRVLR